MVYLLVLYFVKEKNLPLAGVRTEGPFFYNNLGAYQLQILLPTDARDCKLSAFLLCTNKIVPLHRNAVPNKDFFASPKYVLTLQN